MRSPIITWVLSLQIGLCACSRSPPQPAQQPADAIWLNGTIVTLNDQQPTVQAVAVRDGRIVAVGRRGEMMRLQGAQTRVQDLDGRTLVPGFIDPHGHVSGVGLQALCANLLPPPDGTNASIAELQQTLREFMRSSQITRQFKIVLGFGYDESQLRERRHPTRDDLDAVSRELPILIMHQSGHLGVANSKALQLVDITAATKDPIGGVYRRRLRSQEPNGVMEELALFGSMMQLFPRFDQDQSIAMLERGQDLYLRYGYTTIQDGRASFAQVETAIAAAERGRLKADLVSYPDVLDEQALQLLQPPWYHDTTQQPSYRSHLRIGGIKLTLDGSPQGKTAWLSKPYFKPPEGLGADYAGYGVVGDKVVLDVFTQALRNHRQVLTHANGDRAIDQLLDNMGKAERAVPGTHTRPVLIHGQTLREDQLGRLQQLGIFPSLFPMHTFYWGDWHRDSVLGPQRAENISPTGWLVQRGMHFTTHHDAPVALPNSIRVLAATVNRTTRSGYVLGPAQRVEPLVALKAMTLWAAEQYFEEHSKGSIEVGKLADFAVLSDNPLTMDRTRLIELEVLETIKEGRSIYTAGER